MKVLKWIGIVVLTIAGLLFAFAMGWFQQVWDHLDYAVAGLLLYLALKEIDNLKFSLSSLQYRVSKLEAERGVSQARAEPLAPITEP